MKNACARTTRPRGLFIRVQASPAPQRQQQPSGTPLRMAPLALAVEGPGSGERREQGEETTWVAPHVQKPNADDALARSRRSTHSSADPLALAPSPHPTKKKTGRRRFPDPFETSSSSSAAAAAAAPPSATLQKAKEQSGHPCLSTKDAYSSFSRVAGPPIDAERLAAAAAGPPLSATVVAEVAGGPLSGRRVRPPPFDDEGGDGGKGKDGPFRPRVPAAAGREESSEALLREVRARHGGC